MNFRAGTDAFPGAAHIRGVRAGDLLTATALVIGLYALQFLLQGAKIFHLMPAFRVYRDAVPVESIPVEFQYDLEAVLPNVIGALVIGSAADADADVIMLRYQAVAFLFVLAVALFGVWRRSVSPFGLLLVFAMAQIPKVNLAWIGKPDLFMIGFLLLAVWFAGRSITTVFGFLAALSHPVIGVLASLVLAAAMFAFSSQRLNRTGRHWLALVWTPLGAVLGSLTASVFLRIRFPTMAGRAEWAETAGNDLYLNVLPNLAAFTVIALLPMLPLFLLAQGPNTRLVRTGTRVRWLVLLAAAAGCLVASAFFALDHSRVLTLLSFPFVALAVVTYAPRLTAAFRRQPVLAAYLLLLGLAVPALVMDGWLGFTNKAVETWLEGFRAIAPN